MKNQHGTRVSKTQLLDHQDPNRIHEFQFLQFIKNQTKTQPHEDLNPRRRLFPKEEKESDQT